MGTAINHAAAVKRLEALFTDIKIDPKPTPTIHEYCEVETKKDVKCEVHGGIGAGSRRGSLGNVLRESGHDHYVSPSKGGLWGSGVVGPRRESMPALNVHNYYR